MVHITKQQVIDIVERELPFARYVGAEVDEIGPGHVVCRMRYKPELVRPGGTISGPALMSLADFAMFVAVMSLIGPVELAVTTNLNINFLRKPGQEDVLAVGSVLKQGKRLAVMEVDLYSGEIGPDNMVAHVTGTYSIPPTG
ncbi:PaaI family thioesterase [Roseospirillum parvum]|uniref:Uncharacterized domain 1-containing protein n=1 Tax=Roseospirillum parvum TaxID=83401 RepID=A0A1G7WJ91_9PROT|nr:PaaI family thioesterase [Roseospirillum parvum]SDG71938.1 uncharacterized domain 1-containing protein [Roseospirillum parvum]